jgi:hypothetical protein
VLFGASCLYVSLRVAFRLGLSLRQGAGDSAQNGDGEKRDGHDSVPSSCEFVCGLRLRRSLLGPQEAGDSVKDGDGERCDDNEDAAELLCDPEVCVPCGARSLAVASVLCSF